MNSGTGEPYPSSSSSLILVVGRTWFRRRVAFRRSPLHEAQAGRGRRPGVRVRWARGMRRRRGVGLPATQVLLRRAVERHHRPRRRRGQRVIAARRRTAAAGGIMPGVGEAVHHLRGRRWRVGAVGAPGRFPARECRIAARVPAHRGVGNGVAAARRTGRRRHHEHVLKQERNLLLLPGYKSAG